MPFNDEAEFFGPLAIPEAAQLNPKVRDTGGSILAAAFRTENTIVSELNDLDYDRSTPIDPEYRPWEDVQGTKYETYSERFAGARNSEDVGRMKMQIDREIEDRSTLDAAGWQGWTAQMGAAVLSPTSFLPGGALIKGTKAVSIAKTSLSVGVSASVATSIDEAFLQSSQETRTGAESAFAIGGSFILGNMLGAAAVSMSKSQFKAASIQVEDTLKATSEVDDALRSVGAAENRRDLSIRREKVFQAINAVPGLRAVVRSDPILRGQLSPIDSSRRATAQLAETPLQYKINEDGQSVLAGDVSVETRIKDRDRNELSKAIGGLQKSYGEYWKDGSVGTVGTITAPITARFARLLNKTEKLNATEFMEEVGKAMRDGDKHPIPQVQAAADSLRRDIFDKIKDEAIELDIFDPDLQIANAKSYFTRVYKTEKIRRNLKNGSEEDIIPVLRQEFARRRDQAMQRVKEREAEFAAAAKAKDKPEGDAIERTLSKDDERDDFFANFDEQEIEDAIDETLQSLLGMRSGQHSYEVAFASPTRARVLDVADDLLEPWLESNAEVILSQYFRSMVPNMEMTRTFGKEFLSDFDGSVVAKEINEEALQKMAKAKTAKEKSRIDKARKENLRDLKAMRDRMRGVYGVPQNPENFFVQAGRTGRTVSFMGYLGGMMLSAIPDVAGVVGRSGIEGAFGSGATLVTDPKRFFKSAKDMSDIGAGAEWYLNSRAQSIGEILDPYGKGTKLERILAQGARNFSIGTGMIHWNMAGKSVGMASVGSRMAKASDAVRAGKVSQKDVIKLAENGIEPWMAVRIANQLDKHGDKNGQLWLPQGRLWTDKEAFDAFRRAMNRESDLMVITPGQDKPLAFSNEFGKFFLQFKSFAFSAHHRILLSGIQRADADVLAQFTTAVLLGGLVSNIKADMGRFDRKKDAAFWEDAIDRSGLAGWLFEIYNPVSALSAGKISISGEPVSRFKSRSQIQGLLGPTVDMTAGIGEAITGYSSGKQSYRDVRKIMRPVPGNNIWWLLPMFRKIEEAVVDATGAKPRE